MATVCGTGIGLDDGVRPGDPSGSVTLSAVAVFGGIDVRWTMPGTNAHAVAHTLLYRGTNSNFAASIQRGVVSGNSFYDRIEGVATYYYWIRNVSVNGTVSDLYGPASATTRVLGVDIAEELTGLIGSGILATALREDIAKITLNYNELVTEIGLRIAGDSALSEALVAVQNGLLDSMAFIHAERVTRTDGLNAVAAQMTLIGAVNAANAAAIITEQTARVDANTAMASQINGLYVATAGATDKAEGAAAAVLVESNVRTSQNAALATQISTVQSTLAGNIASVQQSSQTAIATANAANTAAQNAAALANTANNSAITSGTQATAAIAESTLANALANKANDKVLLIGALYTAKVAVNGLVGGFGVYNDGSEIEAGFEVDRFWIGRTANLNGSGLPGVPKQLPFMIDGGVVYIDKARIRNADIDTLKIGGNAVTVPFYAGFGTISYGNRVQTEWQWLVAGSLVVGTITYTNTHGGFHSANITFGLMHNTDGVIASTFSGYSFGNYGNGVATAAVNVPYDGWYAFYAVPGGESGGICTSLSITGMGAKR